jgi:hypothetical protein
MVMVNHSTKLFSLVKPKEDIDRRNEVSDDFYSTSAMREEMTGVISQSITLCNIKIE